ncbi:methyl-accepting chemotaxis protein [Ramlibacter sp. H39-3-26]|nr:methyl-accepting chemotaxis protein [Ramlibacter sp. H39-3-26]MDF1484380.1 methyl-accepting chemotaxis protein [Ramlibacter sp. H39-3-26]
MRGPGAGPSPSRSARSLKKEIMTMTLTQTPKSLSRKMTYGVVFLLLLTTVVVVGVMSLRVQPRVIQVSGELIEQTGTAIVGEMSRQLARTQGVTVSVARLAESLPPDEQVYKTVAPAIIDDQGNTALAGGGIWPEPGRFTQGVERRSFFWARDASSRLVFSDDYNAPSGAGYHGEGWYTGARGKPGNACVWSDAYQDPVSHVAMVTCSVPYQLSGSFAGVATTDMALDGIARFLEQRGSTTGGYAFAVDATGQLLWFPGLASKEMTTLEKLAGAQTWLQPVAARLPSLSDKVTVDLDHDERLGGASKVALFRMPETGWVIGLATPEERYIYLANATMRDILVFLLPLLAAVLAFAWLWGRHVIRRLDATRQALDEISHGDGDLARRLVDPQRDEIAGVALAFNRFVDKLSRVLLSVRGSSDFVAQAVSRLDADNQNLASRTSQQATAMEESAAALEQLMSSVQQNAENIHVADKMVNETVEFVEENGMAMRKVVGVMNEIETSSRKVSEIIGVINSIAFQTNILALNAAVEAARAGEQGPAASPSWPPRSGRSPSAAPPPPRRSRRSSANPWTACAPAVNWCAQRNRTWGSCKPMCTRRGRPSPKSAWRATSRRRASRR